MPLLRKGVPMPVKGIDFSIPATFIDDQAGFPQNMRYFKGEMRKRAGKTQFGAVVPDASQIMGMGALETSSGIKYLVRASKTKLQKYNTGTSLWEDIAVTPFSGTDTNFFHFITVTEDEQLIITNFYDRIRKWNGSGNATLLGGNPPLAKTCAYLSPYLLLGHTNDGSSIKPWEVTWCDTNNIANWTTGNSGSRLLSDEPSPLQRLMKLNEYVACYKKDSIWLGRKVETNDIFLFDCMKTGLGLLSPRSVADADGKHFFMGLNDFYVWNGVREEPIGGPVRDEVFNKIDRSKADNCFALHVQELTEIWFFIVVTGYSYPTEIWKYNYRTGFWYYDTCLDITAAIRWEKISTLSWDDEVGTWDQANDIWDSGISSQKWEEIVFGNASGYCQYLDYNTTDDNGVAVSGQFATKDFTADQLEIFKRWLRIDVWAKGVGKLYVDYSVDSGDTWVNIPSSPTSYLDLDGTPRKYELYFDVVSEQIRFRFRNAESGETFYLRNFQPYYLSREEKRS